MKTRRIQRSESFEIALEVSDENFIRPPRESQRNWLLKRVLREAAEELHHQDRVSADFVRGAEAAGLDDRTQGELEDDEIMEDWQIPVMRAMVESVVREGDRVLEVGFGRGVASSMIQGLKPSMHCIVECNDSVVARFHRWAEGRGGADIRLLHGLWQDVLAGDGEVGLYDAIFFHTYPLNGEEFADTVGKSSTFAEHFFDTARRLLGEGGRFTYLTSELDSLSRAHQRALLERFSAFRTSLVRGLEVPEDTHDATWGDSMVVVCAEC